MASTSISASASVFKRDCLALALKLETTLQVALHDINVWTRQEPTSLQALGREERAPYVLQVVHTYD